MMINNENYRLQCHIVDDNLMPMRMILGRDFLEQVMVTIVRGVPTIQKLTHEIPENDIMLIQPFEESKDVSKLEGIQEITDPRMRAEVIKLVSDYKPKKVVKSCIQMEIVVEDNVPVYQNPRRLSAMEREVANDMVSRFLKEGIIRPNRSPYASPILLRKKKNGTYRFCVDYRKINTKIIKDRYPLPLMEDIIEDLKDDLVFTSIDLTDGFYHVDVAENSTKYTSFITPDGQWEFIKAPQGLCNSPATFQRYINTVFHDAKQQRTVKLYLDDGVISSHDEESNLIKLKRTLEIAADAGLKINFNKCKFLQRKINFLGYVIENHNKRKEEGYRTFSTTKQLEGGAKFPWSHWILPKIYSTLRIDSQAVVRCITKRKSICIWQSTRNSISYVERKIMLGSSSENIQPKVRNTITYRCKRFGIWRMSSTETTR